MSDDAWVEVKYPPRHERLMPPDRYVVPATALPLLEPGTVVSWGEPGRWWLLDAGCIVGQPTGAGEEETYRIRPWAEDYAAWLFSSWTEVDGERRLESSLPRSQARTVTAPTSRIWVYRDVEDQKERMVTELPPLTPHSWFDRVLDDDQAPPPLLRPRPARELPSLNGRMLHQLSQNDEWARLIAVSEPMRSNGPDIVVKVVYPRDWYGLLAGDGSTEPVEVALSTLWTY